MHFTQALYPSTLHKHFIKALHTSTLSKHFTEALYTSTLNKHFIQALYTSTLSKHFTQALYQSTLSKHFIKVFLKHFRNTRQGITKVLRQGITTSLFNLLTGVRYYEVSLVGCYWLMELFPNPMNLSIKTLLKHICWGILTWICEFRPGNKTIWEFSTRNPICQVPGRKNWDQVV